MLFGGQVGLWTLRGSCDFFTGYKKNLFYFYLGLVLTYFYRQVLEKEKKISNKNILKVILQLTVFRLFKRSVYVYQMTERKALVWKNVGLSRSNFYHKNTDAK